MAEKKSKVNGTGLFATQRFEPGAVILTEQLLVQCQMPSSDNKYPLAKIIENVRKTSDKGFEELYWIAQKISPTFKDKTCAQFQTGIREPLSEVAQVFIRDVKAAIITHGSKRVDEWHRRVYEEAQPLM